MDLFFPNARLLVYNNLLNEKNDCYSATIKAASELGLLPVDFIPQATIESASKQDNCGAINAAREILKHSLIAQKLHQEPADPQHDKIWQSITAALEAYKQAKLPEYKPGQTIDKNACVQLAPIVLDILLQHLVSYL